MARTVFDTILHRRHDHPRTLAGYILLKIGTVVAIFYTLIAELMFPHDPRFNVIISLSRSALYFERIVLTASIIAFALFAGKARSNAFSAATAGAMCDIVASFTPMLISDLSDLILNWHFFTAYPGEILHFLQASFASNAFLVTITHTFSLFVPEIIGGVCGYKTYDALKKQPA